MHAASASAAAAAAAAVLPMGWKRRLWVCRQEENAERKAVAHQGADVATGCHVEHVVLYDVWPKSAQLPVRFRDGQRLALWCRAQVEEGNGPSTRLANRPQGEVARPVSLREQGRPLACKRPSAWRVLTDADGDVQIC